MTEMFGEAWSPMSVPDLAPDDDDDDECYLSILQSLTRVGLQGDELRRSSAVAQVLAYVIVCVSRCFELLAINHSCSRCKKNNLKPMSADRRSESVKMEC